MDKIQSCVIKSIFQIKKLIAQPMSGLDIQTIIGKSVPIIKYSDLSQYDDIYDVFDGYDVFTLLYETKDNYGHWTCVILHRLADGKPHSIEFFDSYGLLIDDQLDFVSESFKVKNDMEETHLGWLLYESKLIIEYNDRQLQTLGKDINTCGRLVALRILTKKYHIDEFNHWIDNPISFANPTITHIVDKLPNINKMRPDYNSVFLTQPFLN